MGQYYSSSSTNVKKNTYKVGHGGLLKEEGKIRSNNSPAAHKSTKQSKNNTKGPAQINSYDKCMLQLKIQRDNLKKAVLYYEQKSYKERDLALQMMRGGRRDMALHCLRRKRAQEVHIARTTKYLNNIFEMIETVDSRALENEVASALAVGTEELKALQEHISLDDIQQMWDTAEEQMMITKHVSELLAQNLTDVDEDMIEAELEALIANNNSTNDIRLLSNEKGKDTSKEKEDNVSEITSSVIDQTAVTDVTTLIGESIIVPSHEPIMATKIVVGVTNDNNNNTDNNVTEVEEKMNQSALLAS